jgi:hypothetical protein
MDLKDNVLDSGAYGEGLSAEITIFIPCLLVSEHWCSVISTPASYSEGSDFESRLANLQHWFKSFIEIFNPTSQTCGSYFK